MIHQACYSNSTCAPPVTCSAVEDGELLRSSTKHRQLSTWNIGREHLWRKLMRRVDCEAAVIESAIVLTEIAFLQQQDITPQEQCQVKSTYAYACIVLVDVEGLAADL